MLEVFKRLLLMRKKHSSQTIDEYNRDIELSERDIAANRVYTQSQIENLRGEWKKSL